jgi:hypothetical protein
MLPGALLHRIATRYCSPTTCERVIEPLIADFQREWLSADRPASRAIARIRGYTSFWQTLLLCGARATPQILTTRPVPFAIRGLIAVAFPLAVVFGVGWFRTGRISWSEGIREPGLVPFWLGGFWPIWSEWRRRPAGERPHLTIVMCVPILFAAVLCWFYPTRIDQAIILSLTFLILEPVFALTIARGKRSHEILRQIDERAKQINKKSG